MLKSPKFWIGLIVSALCLYFVFRGIDVKELGSALAKINIWVLIGTVIIYIAGYYTRAFRWHYLLKHIKPFKPNELFPYLVMGFMFNNILPARAGEFIRAYITGAKKGISKSTTFASIMIERVFDGLVMIFFFIIGYMAFNFVSQVSEASQVELFGKMVGVKYVKDTVMYFAAAGSLLFIGIFVMCALLIFKKEPTVEFIHKILSIFPEKFAKKFNELIDRFIEGFGVLRNLGDLLMVLLLSMIAWGVEAGTYYLMALAMGLQMNFLLVCLIMAVANFAIMAPSTSGGVGPFEFFAVGVMLIFQYTKEQAVSYVLLIHAMILLPIIALGIIFVVTEGFKFDQLVKAKDNEKNQ